MAAARVTLPEVLWYPSRVTPAQSDRGQDAKAPVVLVVDDDEANRDMLSRRLQRLGYRVVLAEDAPVPEPAHHDLSPVRDERVLRTQRAMGDPRLVEEHVARVHKSERRVEKIYRAAFVELFGPDARGRMAAEDDAVEALLDALRRREVYRHMSNAADRLEAAGRVVLDIAVAST